MVVNRTSLQSAEKAMSLISPVLDQEIRQIVRDCGLQAKQMASQTFEVFEKGLEDYVTSIDMALDQRLSHAFAALFPEDGVISEEDARSRQNFYTDYLRLWCIDPLDGTEDLIQGRPNYAVMVGALQAYQPVAGWIYAPSYDKMYFGGKDWGLFEANGSEAAIALPVVEPSLAARHRLIIGHRDRTRYGDAIAEYIPTIEFHSLGSFGLKVMEVVMGKAGLYLYLNGRVKIWDTAGPLAMALAAGLTCCTLEGQPLKFSPDKLNSETLAHEQSILVGWADLVEQLRPRLEKAVQATLCS
jgi:3'(2'), 5'-bisphosphate nucleotidase